MKCVFWNTFCPFCRSIFQSFDWSFEEHERVVLRYFYKHKFALGSCILCIISVIPYQDQDPKVFLHIYFEESCSFFNLFWAALYMVHISSNFIFWMWITIFSKIYWINYNCFIVYSQHGHSVHHICTDSSLDFLYYFY